MAKMNFLNTKIDNLTMAEAIQEIERLLTIRQRSYVVTPNVDHIVRQEYDREFRKVYDQASLVLVDGMPLIWISKLFRRPIKEKVSGSDLFPEVCNLAALKGYSVFLLGAAAGIADIAADKLKQKFKGLNIVGTFSPQYGFEKDEVLIEEVINIVNGHNPDILVLGLGTPKQEKFYYQVKDRMNIPLTLAAGASIDFAAGHVKRAPRWMQNCGLEWFYRLCKEPKRMFKRYIIDDLKIIIIAWKYRRN